jgi:hypothetical protein
MKKEYFAPRRTGARDPGGMKPQRETVQSALIGRNRTTPIPSAFPKLRTALFTTWAKKCKI